MEGVKAGRTGHILILSTIKIKFKKCEWMGERSLHLKAFVQSSSANHSKGVDQKAALVVVICLSTPASQGP